MAATIAVLPCPAIPSLASAGKPLLGVPSFVGDDGSMMVMGVLLALCPPSPGTANAGGAGKLKECPDAPVGLVSTSFLSNSTTGKVRVRSNTLGAETTPKALCQIVLSPQDHSVGNSVAQSSCGEAKY